MLSNEDLNRYSSHLILNDFTIEHQINLKKSCVLIAGAGGLGGLVAMQLAGAGVGEILLFDHDQIEVSNLQRQLFFQTDEIGQSKSAKLKQRIHALNPAIKCKAFERVFPGEYVPQGPIDLVIDCTDRFESRFEINRWCLRQNIPLVSGAAIESRGIVGLFRETPQSPCYACFVPETNESSETCHSLGVVAPLVGIISSLQSQVSLEYLKHKKMSQHPETTQVLRFNIQNFLLSKSQLEKDPACASCSQQNQ